MDVDLRDVEHLHMVMTALEAETDVAQISRHRDLSRRRKASGRVRTRKKRAELVFKRRDPLGWCAWLREQVYPRGGFKRATRYVVHRMRRLPDQPHRVARGFCRVVHRFLPLPGCSSGGLGRCTADPWQCACSASGDVQHQPGHHAVLCRAGDVAGPLDPWDRGSAQRQYIGKRFCQCGKDLWFNFMSIFGPERQNGTGFPVLERNLPALFHRRAWAGLLISAAAYYLTIPLVDRLPEGAAATANERSERRRRCGRSWPNAAAKLKRKRR
jgi:uncharacterized protein